MEIKIWGCRGSLPTPGIKTAKYGGNTTCLEIRLKDGTLLIIDAGSGLRNLGRKIYKENNCNINFLITHSHWDHLMGFPFFQPAYFKKFNINFFQGPTQQGNLKNDLHHQMEEPYFPVDFSVLKANINYKMLNEGFTNLGSAKISYIPLNHPNGGYGYKIEEDNKVFVFLTDNELEFDHKIGFGFDDYVEFCKDVDILFHDAQYTNEEYEVTRGWGHTTYDKAVELSAKSNVKEFYLLHHDPDRYDQELDKNLKICKNKIKKMNKNVTIKCAKEGELIIL